MATYLARASATDKSAAVSRPLRSSLCAFIRAAWHPPTALARAIVIVLAVKLVAVAAMFVFFHFVHQPVVADAGAVSRLIGPVSLP